MGRQGRPLRFNSQPPEGGCAQRRTGSCRSRVSTHSRPKAAASWCVRACVRSAFQLTAARRRLPKRYCNYPRAEAVSTHSRPKAAARPGAASTASISVSTHSRPKAAAATRRGLNRQHQRFQLTAARRRLRFKISPESIAVYVSTHSRPKAAAAPIRMLIAYPAVSTHSRPKAAAGRRGMTARQLPFQLTAARRRLPGRHRDSWWICPAFQLTAARRRLHVIAAYHLGLEDVSTHSRPKAAACGRDDANAG